MRAEAIWFVSAVAETMRDPESFHHFQLPLPRAEAVISYRNKHHTHTDTQADSFSLENSIATEMYLISTDSKYSF